MEFMIYVIHMIVTVRINGHCRFHIVSPIWNTRIVKCRYIFQCKMQITLEVNSISGIQ